VIGQRCIIGANTVIRNSYLFDGVVIGPQCVIEQSILSTNVNVKENSEIQRGCLIGEDVVLGPQAQLAPLERVSKKREKTVSKSDAEDGEEDNEEVEAERSKVTSILLCPRVDWLCSSRVTPAHVGKGLECYRLAKRAS
jgi:translation initiation factor eIF-2B subunit epsilon